MDETLLFAFGNLFDIASDTSLRTSEASARHRAQRIARDMAEVIFFEPSSSYEGNALRLRAARWIFRTGGFSPL
jgi:hypothetical protein